MPDKTAGHPVKLSIIIVNYNVKHFLEQALIAVEKACRKVSAEIIVVDNNSLDGSVEMVRGRFPGVQIIANQDNRGFSYANNQGIKIAQGEYILLLNPDTVVEEDSFVKVIAFMDQHSDAGGLGVKMIDGSGRYLPESKRGLPTPPVAFAKVFGLSALFPKSRLFGRYHLGFLDKDAIHPVEILSGACMFIRREALEKTGLLDEDFFMYGEDIDLSYRILKAGYRNYYFPETTIIHYKGESTKKSSINYVFVFYRAMIIFARKHFSQKNAKLFSVLINLAIYFRAFIAISGRVLKRMLLPLTDAAIVMGGMYMLKIYWESTVKAAEGVTYPSEYMLLVVPGYVLFWLVSMFLSGGYDKPVHPVRIIRGIATGTVGILVVYALLSEEFRFSRAMILLGAVWATTGILALRGLLSLTGLKDFQMTAQSDRKLIIVGTPIESQRILSLLKMTGSKTGFVGYVEPLETRTTDQNHGSDKSMGHFYLGKTDKLTEIINLYRVDEVIFCASDVSSHEIIRRMSAIPERDVEFKIAPPESLFIIGSSSVDNNGDLYMIDLNAISKPVNRRNKRIFDIATSVLLVLLSPVLIFMVENTSGMFINIFRVLIGTRSWVGFNDSNNENGNGKIQFNKLIRKGILTPTDMAVNKPVDSNTVMKLNLLYAKDYHVYNDIHILSKAYRQIGRSNDH